MPELSARYLGLDVHKDTIAVAIAEGSGPPEFYGQISNQPKADCINHYILHKKPYQCHDYSVKVMPYMKTKYKCPWPLRKG